MVLDATLLPSIDVDQHDRLFLCKFKLHYTNTSKFQREVYTIIDSLTCPTTTNKIIKYTLDVAVYISMAAANEREDSLRRLAGYVMAKYIHGATRVIYM